MKITSPIMERARQAAELLQAARTIPTRAAKYVTRLAELAQATHFAERLPRSSTVEPRASWAENNPLHQYVGGHVRGRGIWKWDHYLEIYHRHLSKFVGSSGHLVEIGIFSGGSLEMWRNYLGARARITGVDIQPACSVYETEGTRIEIGDQADRSFWRDFVARAGSIDIVIDDGGHTHEQQRVTLEELLPHMSPGGVFICEDVHGVGNPFAAYSTALADQLNAFRRTDADIASNTYASITTPFQQLVKAVHFYPYMVVVERSDVAFERFVCERRGTEWQPFL